MRIAGILVLIWMTGAIWAMEVKGTTPGNLFVTGKPLRFTITQAKGIVRYQLADYWGRHVAEGEVPVRDGKAEVRIKAQPLGYYTLRCTDEDGTAVEVAVGVVVDRKNAPLPREGRVCADAASAWLVQGEERWRTFAHVVRTAGIPWVRERISWGHVAPNRRQLDWKHYQYVADVLAQQGIHVYQIWHDSPAWSHPDNPSAHCPDDLRTVYRFAREASSHFAGQIQAWEVWNEPDIEFWRHLSDRYAGLLKVTYLGLKDGNPNALVLQGSLCIGVRSFARHLFENGIGDYFDIFNWHIYDVPSNYPRTLHTYRQLLAEHGLDDRLAWLTEAGIRLPGTEGAGKRILSEENQRKQCQFVPMSVVMSLAAGNDKHFFFVLPDYLENGIQFGALRPDMSPYPSLIALSACANLLGASRYLGEYPTGVQGASAHLFSTPRGNVLVAWSEKPVTIRVPTEKRTVRLANIFGAESVLKAEDGSLQVQLAPEAVYLVNVSRAIMERIQPASPRTGRLPQNKPSRIVVVGYTNLPIDKGRDCYLFRPGEGFDYTVEVYHFGEGRVNGTVSLSLSGGSVQPQQQAVQVQAMGRQVLTFRVTPDASAEEMRIEVRGDFGAEKVSPSVSYLVRQR